MKEIFWIDSIPGGWYTEEKRFFAVFLPESKPRGTVLSESKTALLGRMLQIGRRNRRPFRLSLELCELSHPHQRQTAGACRNSGGTDAASSRRACAVCFVKNAAFGFWKTAAFAAAAARPLHLLKRILFRTDYDTFIIREGLPPDSVAVCTQVERRFVMNIKKTHVYKSIRMAALQNILSLNTLVSGFCTTLLAQLLYEICFDDPNQNFKMTVTTFFSIFLLIFAIYTFCPNYIQDVIALISPEKSIAAKQYAESISFENMCIRVESQYLSAPYHWEHWRLCLLKDFIIYEHYGAFFVIPYAAVQDIVPWENHFRMVYDAFSSRTAAAIQDIFSHKYVILFDNNDEKAQFTHSLNAILQEARENGGHL